jgi:hypothetical protein
VGEFVFPLQYQIMAIAALYAARMLANMTSETVSCPFVHSVPTENYQTEICIVGGGISGVCAAIAAARSGVKVVLIQDRPMLGGNASSEVRMWICGANGRFNKESGILEEIQLLNQYRNPSLKYTVWDTVFYEKVLAEPNIQLILNCSVCEVNASNHRIQSLRAWHLIRQCWIDIVATQFIDCSGDSILRYSGAEFRWGRESVGEFDESLARKEMDRQTMGNSILIQLREIDPKDHFEFVPPVFARKIDANHPRADCFKPSGHNFWWLEIGGELDTIDDADRIRDELYAMAYGVWDFIKNHPDGRGKKWELEWIGSLPGKRENVRYVGDYTFTQNDIDAGGQSFTDTIAYGGWTMDDHPPAAFDYEGWPTKHHSAPSPYGIPYRILYSRNIENLMFAGRNISATHMALSSTRVMGTCAMLGQAAGTAAAMAVARAVSPREIGQQHIHELQNRLLESDQWIPGHMRALPRQTIQATIRGEGILGDLSVLLDGHERRLKDGDHWVEVRVGGSIEFRWKQPVLLEKIRLVLHSNLHEMKRMPATYLKQSRFEEMPKKLAKDFSVQIYIRDQWLEIARVDNNHKRLVQLDLSESADRLRIVVESTWGDDVAAVFACEVGKTDYTSPPTRVDWPEIIMIGAHSGTA